MLIFQIKILIMYQFNTDFQFLFLEKLEAVYSAISTEVVAYQLAYLYTFVWHKNKQTT